MKVFISTRETFGRRKNDFVHTHDDELLRRGMEDDKENIDALCGCRRSLIGFESQRGTSIMRVVDMDISYEDFVVKYTKSLRDAGYAVLPEAEVAEEVDELLEIADSFADGTVVERRGTTFWARDRA